MHTPSHSNLVLAVSLILTVAAGSASCAADGVDESDSESSADEISGAFPVGTNLVTTADLKLRSSPSPSARILVVIPQGTLVKSAAAAPRAGWYGITWDGRTGWVDGAYLAKPTVANSGGGAALIAYHDAGDVELWDQTFGRNDGADPLANIRAAAAGRNATRSCYGNAPCGSVRLSSALLSSMVALRERYGFRYFVTAIAGAEHSPGSYHYDGRALDLDTINGSKIDGDSALARSFLEACNELGAVEALGPSNRSDHQDHIHCAF